MSPVHWASQSSQRPMICLRCAITFGTPSFVISRTPQTARESSAYTRCVMRCSPCEAAACPVGQRPCAGSRDARLCRHSPNREPHAANHTSGWNLPRYHSRPLPSASRNAQRHPERCCATLSLDTRSASRTALLLGHSSKETRRAIAARNGFLSYAVTTLMSTAATLARTGTSTETFARTDRSAYSTMQYSATAPKNPTTSPRRQYPPCATWPNEPEIPTETRSTPLFYPCGGAGLTLP